VLRILYSVEFADLYVLVRRSQRDVVYLG
jgi:hypothetical protein